MPPTNELRTVAAGRVVSLVARTMTSLVIGAAISLLVLWLAQRAAPAGNAPLRGDIGVLIESPSGAIPVTRDKAIDVASEAAGDLVQSSVPDAFLVTLTDPTVVGADESLRGRSVWVVRYLGLAIPGDGPIREDGTGADGGEFHRMYVYVDAVSGEWLFSRLED